MIMRPVASVALSPPPSPTRSCSYGCVVTDAAGARILLAQPTGFHLGYRWTFPKGTPEPGESPQQTAIRETAEELGWDVELLAPLGRWFGGPSWSTWFWLAQGRAPCGAPCWETQAVQWFTWDEAVDAINETTSAHRRLRDQEVCAWARKTAKEILSGE